ncbi:MAG TPA: phosphatase PAP2 family protein [Thermoanaerobaculia bacterium]|jgi:membrane-associated phospholipid phosphatase
MTTIRWIQHLFGTAPHGVFLTVTFLGASVVLWTLLVLYHWLVDPRFGRRLAVVLALSVVVNHLLKGLFGTSRPYDLDALLSTENARRTGTGHGFPSGHSQNAATFWPAFALHFRRAWFWALAVLIILIVGLSRLYLGVHMPIDVLGGFALGALFAWLAAGWSGPRPLPWRRGLWVPAAGVALLALAFLSEEPHACGLLAGCLIARPGGFEPPRTAAGRIGIVIGGVLSLALLALLFFWLPDRIVPDLSRSTPAAFLGSLVLAWTGFDLWPRLWTSVRS